MLKPSVIKKKKEEVTQITNAEAIDLDLRVREGATLVVSDLINDYAPTQNSPAVINEATTLLVNVVMSDYNGGLKKEQILARNDDKLFLPQPGMLAHWSEDKNFQQLKPNGNKLSPQDVAGKYVLTYYPPLAQSWARRTSDNIADNSNKHWYSHCKASIYDEHGKPIASANPEAAYNDVAHDATVYVPNDSYSYVVDYKALGLKKDDITEGFQLQSEGINIMSPDIQNSVFRLKAAGMSTQDIITLWKQNADIANPRNIAAIEKHLKGGNSVADLKKLNLIKSDNKYRYNLQDNSCAIQPTAPVLYATAARIKRENMNEAEADAFRTSVGLYNIYDEQKYGKINEKFYDTYKKQVFDNFSAAVKDEVKYFIDHPKDSLSALQDNTIGATKWVTAKTQQWAPRAMEILHTKAINARRTLKQCIIEDTKKARDYISSLGVTKYVKKYLPKINVPSQTSNIKKKIKKAPVIAPKAIYSNFRTGFSNAKKWVNDQRKKLAPKATGFIRDTKEAIKRRMKSDAKRARNYISSFSLGRKMLSYLPFDETPTQTNNNKKR